MKRYDEIQLIIDKLGETTLVDTLAIQQDAERSVYEKYELPAFFIENKGEFYQGDATDEEVYDVSRKINAMECSDKYNPVPTVIVYYDDETGELITNELFSFLKRAFLKEYQRLAIDAVVRNWKAYYKEDIRDFLNENYPRIGDPVGYDYSVYIDIETGEIREVIYPSSNWMFSTYEENRKLIVHLENVDKPFLDHTDLIAEGDYKLCAEHFWVELPDNFQEFDYEEQLAWFEENAKKGIDDYNEHMRNNAIDDLINSLQEKE